MSHCCIHKRIITNLATHSVSLMLPCLRLGNLAVATVRMARLGRSLKLQGWSAQDKRNADWPSFMASSNFCLKISAVEYSGSFK